MSTCVVGYRQQLLLLLSHLFLLFGILVVQPAFVAGNDDDDFVVAAYLPEYRSYINVNNTSPYLTDLILFSLAPDPTGNLGPCCLEPHHYAQAREARAHKQQEFPDEKPLKLWLSLGGAGRSNSFSRVAGDKTLRKKFLRNIREKIQKEQFDGVDFDWEAPQSHQEYQNYMDLVQDAHKELFTKAGILISVALHPRQVFHHVFYNHANRINLMTYDMIHSSSSGRQHHASMEQTKAAIELLTKAQCPKSQIVVGIPAYARHGRNPGQVMTYSEIVDSIIKAEPDVDLKGLAHRSNYKGFLMDSPNLVREKVDFALKAGHSGIFFWELGQDKQHDQWAKGGMLLEAAADQVLRSPQTSKLSSTKAEL